MKPLWEKLFDIIDFLKKHKLNKKIYLAITILAITSLILTYIAITHDLGPFGPDPYKVLRLVLIDLVLCLAVSVMLTRKILSFWILKRKLNEGSRLQNRIIVMFALLSALPTIIVAVFSAFLFNLGIDSWFDKRVGGAIDESIEVANLYLEEHQRNIINDALGVSAIIDTMAFELFSNPDVFRIFMEEQSEVRSLTEMAVFQKNEIIAHSFLSFSLLFDKLPDEAMQKARNGEVVIMFNETEDKVRALVKLHSINDSYLLVGRLVDSKAVTHIQNTKGAVNEYNRLKIKKQKMQIKFALAFLLLAILLFIIAVSIAIIFSRSVVRPIRKLVDATERVKKGDLAVKLSEGPENDEIAALSRAFNRMTNQLKDQRDSLLDAAKQIDARRHFSETVLAGVSAGVIALSVDRKLTMINPSACQMLFIDSDNVIGKDFNDILPEINRLLDQAEKNPYQQAQGEINVIRNKKKYILSVKITADIINDEVKAYVITFDDITEFVLTQRVAAWSDVARRIAHEIKNPLTPINLAAERLKRKYTGKIEDSDTFERCTDTISKNVMDIGKMVDEFANFARMPAPIFNDCNICEIIKNVVVMRKHLANNIKYNLILPEKDLIIKADGAQLSQVITNIIKNSEEAIEAIKYPEGENKEISISLESNDNFCIIKLIDNGSGISPEVIDKLTEPYVTNKTKGTGLGLAIVKKIIDDHAGKIEFSNNSDKGVMVKIYLPNR